MGIESPLLNLHWLEEHLGLEWTPAEEADCQQLWENTKVQLITSYPVHAFLLIVRDYMLGARSDFENRLRELIPVLSRMGDPSFSLSAFILLAVFMMESHPKTDVVDTIIHQVDPELGPGSGSMEYILYQYLLAQMAVKSGNQDEADLRYGRVLDESFGMYEPLNFLFGRIYQKTGLYLLRTEGHPLRNKWQFHVDAWCRRYLRSPMARQLQRLCQSTEHPAADPNKNLAQDPTTTQLSNHPSQPASTPVHPFTAWRWMQSATGPEYPFELSAELWNMRELDVIYAIVNARLHPSPQLAEQAVFLADTYGDPFWTQRARACLEAIQSVPREASQAFEATPAHQAVPIHEVIQVPAATQPTPASDAPQPATHSDASSPAAGPATGPTPSPATGTAVGPTPGTTAGPTPSSASGQTPSSAAGSAFAANSRAGSPASPPIEVHTEEPSLRFTYFHTFQGYTAQNQVLFPSTYNRHKVRQLLGIMLLQPRFRIIRDQLMLQLFGEDHSDPEGNYLHVTLHRLRQLLRKQTGVTGDWITVRKDMVVLNENRIDHVDIEEYRKLAAVGHELWQADKEAACDLYTKAVVMYHPVVAPEFEYEDWMSQTRIFLEQQQRRMLKRLWRADRQAGRLDEAVQRGEQLLQLDPFDLTVLGELCRDWTEIGDTKTMQQVCQRTIELLQGDGDPVPDWLTHTVQPGGRRYHRLE